MDTTAIVCIVLGLGCAYLAGFLFGGSVPSWDEDYHNDPHPSEMPRYHPWHGWVYGGWPYWGGCFALVRSGGKLLSVLLAIAAVVLIYGYSGLGSNEGLDEEGGEFLMLFDKRTWLLLGGLATGYVLSVLTDKGPVGPLE